MKKKVRPATVTKTSKKASPKKAVSKKKVATKATKTSKRKKLRRADEEGDEVQPSDPFDPYSSINVDVTSSSTTEVPGFLRVDLRARLGIDIKYFGFRVERVENEDVQFLELASDPVYLSPRTVRLTYTIPPADVGILDESDYTVVILTRKNLS